VLHSSLGEAATVVYCDSEVWERWIMQPIAEMEDDDFMKLQTPPDQLPGRALDKRDVGRFESSLAHLSCHCMPVFCSPESPSSALDEGSHARSALTGSRLAYRGAACL
jgi:hypothetical protein